MDAGYLSLNQITTENWSVPEAIEGCQKAGIEWISFWRHKVSETGLAGSARYVRESGIKVSSLCRGGMFPAATPALRAERIDDNRRAIDEAAELGTDVVVLVCGPLDGCTLDDARKMVEDGIEQLVPYAKDRKIKLGIEPLHPVFAADRSVISTLGQANDIVKRINSPQVGVVIDVYHVWWDPNVYSEIERSTGHIFGFHVNDWLAPVENALMSRGMMGDGCIELERIRRAVQSAGYNGPVEVEILNQKIWDSRYDELLVQMKDRFERLV